ncbi:NAD(P)-binding domain-containing protein, partial [uncultured Enterococcus sp.]
MKIGFIGTGVMGKSIVKHFLAAGHEAVSYTHLRAHETELHL